MRNLKNSKRLFFFRLINVYDMKFEDERLILRRLILKFVEESGKKNAIVMRWQVAEIGVGWGFWWFYYFIGGGTCWKL